MPTKKPRRQTGGARRGAISGGFSRTVDRLAGQEDCEFTTMRYETTSAFTATAGAASFLLHKGNSIYRPYSGNTDSVGGYQRMYTQYRKSLVVASRIEVRLWCGTSGVQEPFRIVLIPCSVTQSTVYTAYSNIASLRDVPHAVEKLFSPGATMPRISARGTSATVLDGARSISSTVESAPVGTWTGTSGADPGTLWYYAVGYQNMAGTTTNNLQAQVMMEFKVKWFEPIATAVQSVTNKWGNEEVPEAKTSTTAPAVAVAKEATDYGEYKSLTKPVDTAGSVLETKLPGQLGQGSGVSGSGAGLADFRKEVASALAAPSTIFASTNVRIDDDYVLIRRAVEPQTMSRSAAPQ